MSVSGAKFRVSKYSDISELKELFKDSFEVTQEEVNFFFLKKFDAESCLVCELNGKVVSGLHLMDANIILRGFKERADYVYAAATLKNFRKCGIMSALLEYSFKVTEKRGKKFSFLRPETPNLYRFYEKFGYKNFFKENRLNLRRDELLNLLKSEKNTVPSNSLKASSNNVHLLLNVVLQKIDGVLWPKNHIEYALHYNRLLKGKEFFVEGGFALATEKNNGMVEINEFFYKNKKAGTDILSLVYDNFRAAKTYYFKTAQDYFENIDGVKNQYCGMIRPVGFKGDFKAPLEAYLGFTL